VTSIAAHERALLCAVAQQLGPDAPTLCGDWTVKDLVIHLLIREGHPAAAGILVPPLRGLLDRATAKAEGEEFASLVTRLRHGPPVLSPFSVPKLGSLGNRMEYYIHHEDLRRAQPGWEPRALPAPTEDGLWSALRFIGRLPAMWAATGVTVERSDTGDRATLKKSSRQVVVRGLPSEVALYVYGRKDQARVELVGDEPDVAALAGGKLGL
jgi:uncharacterized protein (TIGR03085 family)